jgi:hypothetical protein
VVTKSAKGAITADMTSGSVDDTPTISDTAAVAFPGRLDTSVAKRTRFCSINDATTPPASRTRCRPWLGPHRGTADAQRVRREPIAFIAQWATFGDPPEELVLPRFGMARDRLQTTFGDLVTLASRPPSPHPRAEQPAYLGEAASVEACRRGGAAVRRDGRTLRRSGRERAPSANTVALSVGLPASSGPADAVCSAVAVSRRGKVRR